MKRYAARLAFALTAAMSWIAAYPQAPAPAHMILDHVGVLSRDEQADLEQALDHLRLEHGISTMLVIAQSVHPGPIEDYVERLAHRWAGAGGPRPADALFIVVAIDQREMVIMPGSALGLESALQQPRMREGAAPLFRDGRYYDGLLLLADRVHVVIHEKPPAGKVPFERR